MEALYWQLELSIAWYAGLDHRGDHLRKFRCVIYKLTWEAIDRERNVITFTKTKTGKAGIVQISGQLIEIFHSIPRSSERVLCGVYYYELWQQAYKRAKITGLHFHDLRHTAATRLADVGAGPFTIPAILGHKSIRTTARYGHATSERTRTALEKLASTLSQPASVPTAEDPANRSAWRNILRKHG